MIEGDRIPGAPHPRFAPAVIGQDNAIREFTAAASERLHHGWLLTGPRGTGKATLAWSIARWLLSASPQAGLSTLPDDPVAHRIAALSEPGLHLVRRPVDEKTGRLRAEITVEETRRLIGFFHLTSAGGGRRIAIVDAADEMNPSAANALLKLLEEPPAGALLLLISHQPARLLPTIRSRCRELRLAPIRPEDMGRILTQLGVTVDPVRLTALAGGSVGEALRFAGQGGPELYQDLIALFSTLPHLDRAAALRLAEAAGRRSGNEEDPFDLLMTLLDRFFSRAVLSGLLGPPQPEAAEGEAKVLARISPDVHAARKWADAQAELSARARAGRAVNLDPSALVLDMLIRLANRPSVS